MIALEKILCLHAARYPFMRPCDAVKLLYQHVFGGGHLISDPAASLARIEAELAGLPAAVSAPCFEEEIGNGLVRLHLAGLAEHGISPQELNNHFVLSAREISGSREAFTGKLHVLQQAVAAGVFPFSSRELEEYLTSYAAAGYPAVSHSPEYRAAYPPAYRILLKKYL